MMGRPRYPNITVKLSDEDGNAFAILGRVTKAMKRAGLTEDQIKEYKDDATTGDYNHLLVTTINYVEVA